MDKLYRIEYEVDFNDKIKLVLRQLKVLKKTPKGFWIQKYEWTNELERFVLADKNAKKAYAHMTIEGARDYFIRRNITRKKLLEHQLHNVDRSLKLIDNFYKPKLKK